ncbi:MAG: DUF1266 domain-containing protein [Myxococcota bacterium]|nr:DUF1266 domain-containing protein [Deltaproteobacteria bacterium]MDQ3340312.1 DUF1266 domain-containing protein [Myxococcota bacterium]
MLSDAQRWSIALAAIPIRFDLENPTLLGGAPRSDEAAQAARELLGDWKLRDATGVHERISSLLTRAKWPAWDTGRIPLIAGKAYLAGWLDESAALDACLAAARVVQPQFTGWETYGAAYLDGRRRDRNKVSKAQHYVYRTLVLEHDGPWRLPWATPL